MYKTCLIKNCCLSFIHLHLHAWCLTVKNMFCYLSRHNNFLKLTNHLPLIFLFAVFAFRFLSFHLLNSRLLGSGLTFLRFCWGHLVIRLDAFSLVIQGFAAPLAHLFGSTFRAPFSAAVHFQRRRCTKNWRLKFVCKQVKTVDSLATKKSCRAILF